MGNPLTYGYRMNQYGRVEHRLFDLQNLLHGDAAKQGWVDSPDKVPGGDAAIRRAKEAKALTAKTTRREPGTPSHVHGEYAAKRGNQGPRNAKGQFVKK